MDIQENYLGLNLNLESYQPIPLEFCKMLLNPKVFSYNHDGKDCLDDIIHHYYKNVVMACERIIYSEAVLWASGHILK